MYRKIHTKILISGNYIFKAILSKSCTVHWNFIPCVTLIFLMTCFLPIPWGIAVWSSPSPKFSSTTKRKGSTSLLPCRALHITSSSRFDYNFLLYHFIWCAQVLCCATSYVTFRIPPKLINIPWGSNHSSKINSHPDITTYKVTVVYFLLLLYIYLDHRSKSW